jgi:hypothetical protein
MARNMQFNNNNNNNYKTKNIVCGNTVWKSTSFGEDVFAWTDGISNLLLEASQPDRFSKCVNHQKNISYSFIPFLVFCHVYQISHPEVIHSGTDNVTSRESSSHWLMLTVGLLLVKKLSYFVRPNVVFSFILHHLV